MFEDNDAHSSLEGHVVRLVKMGRIIAGEILASDLALHPRQGPLLDRCLRRLSEGQPLHPRDAGGFQSVLGILKREFEAETLGITHRFSGVHDPEQGDVGVIVDFLVVTERGEILGSLLDSFELFLEMRQEILDQLRVENVLAGVIEQ